MLRNLTQLKKFKNKLTIIIVFKIILITKKLKKEELRALLKKGILIRLIN